MWPFGKSDKSKKVQLPTLAEGLAALESLGIRKRADVTIDDLLHSTGGTADEPTEYSSLLCILGGEVERGDFQPISDDVWHFDTECIVDHGDYTRIAEQLFRLSKGALAISNIKDYVSTEESVAWLEFDFHGKRVHWDFTVQDDWVDASVLSNFSKLFRETPSTAHFTYGNLGGQDCLIGFSTEEQRLALSKLTSIQFDWLT
ncbi:MAG TPA: hypothetical protein VGH19_05980 [Verrucomicrobiae bacterium]